MRIVQSFWSGNKNIFQHGFGWLSPQHHLMAWALSCLKLKEHYEDICLYTDTNGYKVLIEQLSLPYKHVEVCYDDLMHYNEHCWVISKILTYLAQKEPFIHVDGDVFIWEKLPIEIERASLLAQNFEISTSYYENAVKKVIDDLVYLPDCLHGSLKVFPVPSYNAGILGGSDIEFFKKYAQTALEMIDKNHDKIQIAHSSSLNVLCEQILFASMVGNEDKKVTCYFKEAYKDNGYALNDIADFSAAFHKLKYIHLVGTHKTNKENCELMSRILYKEYPEYFLKMVSLFDYEHRFFSTKLKEVLSIPAIKNEAAGFENKIIIRTPYPRTLIAILKVENKDQELTPEQIEEYATTTNRRAIRELFKYESELIKFVTDWDKLPARQLYALENNCQVNSQFFFLTREIQLKTFIKRNISLEISETCFDWTTDFLPILDEDNNETPFDPNAQVTIACVPELFFRGFSEKSIDELDYNILALLDKDMPFEELLKELEVCFSPEEIESDYDSIYDLILSRIKELSLKKCIIITQS